jgi:O-methyltransferase involved in polyketide biosynthesis
VKRFLENHPNGTVVNIGCGFDTTFERIDNGTVRWYDLDLPDVIAARKLLIGEHPRRTARVNSFLEEDWLDELEVKNNVLFISAGVLYYFQESQIKEFLKRIASRFPGSEIAFDATSTIWFSNHLVLKKGKFNVLLTWGLKNPAVLTAWDRRIRVTETISMLRDARKMLDGFNRLFSALSDMVKLQYIVRLAIGRK